MQPNYFQQIEKKWQKYWKTNETFACYEDSDKEKFYVLDMFPYPSGEGLHVGHPVGYIASDIIARYKRHKQYNVLHPIGFDAFGLPAEQYAIQTGQHPSITTEKNIAKYIIQLQNLGFSFDWNRTISTADPDFYTWTQWIFIQLYNCWFDPDDMAAKPLYTLLKDFKNSGNLFLDHDVDVPIFTATQWCSMEPYEQENILNKYRMAYLEDVKVNWCPALGTVLSNDEVKDGYSKRGDHPVIQKKMRQWCLRLSSFAERLIMGLDELEWPGYIKEIQKNWIGKTVGATFDFLLPSHPEKKISAFSTHPEYCFGITFLAMSPEHPLCSSIATPEQQEKVERYIQACQYKSDRERLQNVDDISGVFTGTYGIHPLTNEEIPIYIADYISGHFATGIIMGIPAHDPKHYRFAQLMDLPIVRTMYYNSEPLPHTSSYGKMVNSKFMNGMSHYHARICISRYLRNKEWGRMRIYYKLRDPVFSRQRYWGEPIPIYYKDNVPYSLPVEELPLKLPSIEKFLPTSSGKPPLARAKDWTFKGHPLEYHTMPGWAGSSWYFIRYMDPKNKEDCISREIKKYWENVDLYVGGAEHATGHLLYARFIHQFLYDLGYVTAKEPFQKYLNQGMIQGKSYFVYRIKNTNKFVSYNLKDKYNTTALYVHNRLVNNNILDLEGFKQWQPQYKDALFILEDEKYICGNEIEKMSKSKYNVVNPDDIITQYSADTLRVYTMFLGPIEQSKPWDTHGIEGSYRFLVKFWKLFHSEKNQYKVTDNNPSLEEKKILHYTIKKVEQDINKYQFNTAISTMMIAVNQFTKMQCNKKAVLQPLVILLSPFAPHLAEELWQKLGHDATIAYASFPHWDTKYTIEDYYTYPIAIDGKLRTKKKISLMLQKPEVTKIVLENEVVKKWTKRKKIVKIIYVPEKMINIVTESA